MNLSVGPTPEEIVERLSGSGFAAAEVYAKSGESRRFDWSDSDNLHQGKVAMGRVVRAKESGWAIRAGDETGSVFVTGSGQPVLPEMPDPMGLPLRLPDPDLALGEQTWNLPVDDVALAKESDARALFRNIFDTFESEVPQGRLLQVIAEDGLSESRLASSKGLSCSGRRRLATVRLWAEVPSRNEHPRAEATFSWSARALERVDGEALVRGLVDRLLIQQQGQVATRSAGRVLVSPTVMARLLASIVPLFTQPDAWPRLQTWADSHGRVGTDHLTVIDDGGFASGLLRSAFDDEGRRTRAVTLIDCGLPKQPLVPWFHAGQSVQVNSSASESSGCVWRPGWREPPVVAPSHLYLQPSQSTSVADLLDDLETGSYLVACGNPTVHWRKNAFSVSVLGFEVERGEPIRAIKDCRLRGDLKALLSGIVATGRDLQFLAVGGMIGAPTTMIEGLEVVPT